MADPSGAERVDVERLQDLLSELIDQETSKLITAFLAIVKDYKTDTGRITVTPADRTVHMPSGYELERHDSIDVPVSWYRLGNGMFKFRPKKGDLVYCLASMVPTEEILTEIAPRTQRIDGTSQATGLPMLADEATKLPRRDAHHDYDDIIVLPLGVRADKDAPIPDHGDGDAPLVIGVVNEAGTKFESRMTWKENGDVFTYVKPSPTKCGLEQHKQCKPQPPGRFYIHVVEESPEGSEGGVEQQQDEEESEEPPPDFSDKTLGELGVSADQAAQAFGADDAKGLLDDLGLPSSTDELLDQAGVPSLDDLKNMSLNEAAQALGLSNKDLMGGVGEDSINDMMDKLGADNLSDLKNTSVEDVVDAYGKDAAKFAADAAGVSPEKAAEAVDATDAAANQVEEVKNASEEAQQDAKDAADALMSGDVAKAKEKGEDALEQGKKIVETAKQAWDTISGFFGG